jgi:FkbM family methyltransferase
LTKTYYKFIYRLRKLKIFFNSILGVQTIIKTPLGKFFIVNHEETIQKSLVMFNSFEKNLVDIAIILVKNKNGAIVDLGANIGTFTIPLAYEFPFKEVIAFEPQRYIFNHLSANIFINKLTNVVTYKFAIGYASTDRSTIKVPVFKHSEKYTGSVSLDESTIKLRSLVKGVVEPGLYAKKFDVVNLCKLDSINLPKLSLIKIDVEGMELEVMESAINTLKRDLPIIIFETWDLPEACDKNSKIIELVTNLGYICIKMENNRIAFHKKDTKTKQVIEKIFPMLF